MTLTVNNVVNSKVLIHAFYYVTGNLQTMFGNPKNENYISKIFTNLSYSDSSLLRTIGKKMATVLGGLRSTPPATVTVVAY
jgi:hypothetical protein